MEHCSGSNNMEVQKKRKSRSNRLEFIGWGSKPLIEFLETIGKESRKYSQLEVDNIVQQYVTSKNLINLKKKRMILCDEKLHKLFKKKTISRTKVYHLLDVHFIENHDSDDVDDSSDDDSSDEERGREEGEVSSKTPMEKKKDVPKAPRSCFAALTAQNIKLLYLRKKLVIHLLTNNPETFEEKVVGGIVRISSSVNYNFSKNSYQLHQVTGVRHPSGSGETTCLRLSNVMTDVPISKLHDGNFSEEECEEFQEQVKSGLIKRPTLEEFELKAQSLHRDITKHWIDTELKFLNNRIDHTNEKGQRKDALEFTMHEYLKRRELLSTAAEQEKLLSQKPVVAADESEHEETPSGAAEKVEEEGVAGGGEEDEDFCSDQPEQENMLIQKLKDVAEGAEAEATLMGISEKQEEQCSCSPLDVQQEVEDRANYKGSIVGETSDLSAAADLWPSEENNARFGAGNVTVMQPYHPGLTYLGEYAAVLDNQIPCMHLQQPSLGGFSGLIRNFMVQAQLQQPPLGSIIPQPQLQVLGNVEDPNAAIWQGADQQRFIHHPVSLNALRTWFQQGFLAQDFRVWKTGQNQEQSILLIDLLNSSSSQ